MENEEKLKVEGVKALKKGRKSLKKSAIFGLFRTGLSALAIVLFSKYADTDTIKTIGETVGKLGIGLNVLQILLATGMYKFFGYAINKVETGEYIVTEDENGKIKIK
jgi:hypothetical protein